MYNSTMLVKTNKNLKFATEPLTIQLFCAINHMNTYSNVQSDKR